MMPFFQHSSQTSGQCAGFKLTVSFVPACKATFSAASCCTDITRPCTGGRSEADCMARVGDWRLPHNADDNEL